MSEGCGEYIVTTKTGRVCPGEGTYSRFTITTPGGWARLESGGQVLPTVTATGQWSISGPYESETPRSPHHVDITYPRLDSLLTSAAFNISKSGRNFVKRNC